MCECNLYLVVFEDMGAESSTKMFSLMYLFYLEKKINYLLFYRQCSFLPLLPKAAVRFCRLVSKKFLA